MSPKRPCLVPCSDRAAEERPKPPSLHHLFLLASRQAAMDGKIACCPSGHSFTDCTPLHCRPPPSVSFKQNRPVGVGTEVDVGVGVGVFLASSRQDAIEGKKSSRLSHWSSVVATHVRIPLTVPRQKPLLTWLTGGVGGTAVGAGVG